MTGTSQLYKPTPRPFTKEFLHNVHLLGKPQRNKSFHKQILALCTEWRWSSMYVRIYMYLQKYL